MNELGTKGCYTVYGYIHCFIVSSFHRSKWTNRFKRSIYIIIVSFITREENASTDCYKRQSSRGVKTN